MKGRITINTVNLRISSEYSPNMSEARGCFTPWLLGSGDGLHT